MLWHNEVRFAGFLCVVDWFTNFDQIPFIGYDSCVLVGFMEIFMRLQEYLSQVPSHWKML